LADAAQFTRFALVAVSTLALGMGANSTIFSWINSTLLNSIPGARAQRIQVLRLVLGQGLRLTVIGLAIGLALSLALTRLLSSLLFGVTPTDLVTFAGVTLLLCAVVLGACYLPARRATSVDPMVVLRYE
jgi:putative ABC transport system permease protein